MAGRTVGRRAKAQAPVGAEVAAAAARVELFECALPDEASAPQYPKGLLLVWTNDKAPQWGSLVIVRDAAGADHVREYRQGDGACDWIAGANNQAHRSFRSTDDVRIRPVAKWRPMP